MAAAIVNVKNNWWGDASGPVHPTNPGASGDTVSDYIDFEPWEMAPIPGVCVPPDTTPSVVSDLLAVPNPASVSDSVDVSTTVDDSMTGNSNIVSAEYMIEDGAGNPVVSGQMTASDGGFDSPTEAVGTTIDFNLMDPPIKPGIYDLCVVATGAADNASDPSCIMLVVYDPEGGFVAGGGWIDSPEGAYIPDSSIVGKANFGFVAKYNKKTNDPEGNTEFVFRAAGLNFHSESYDWLVVNKNDARAQFKGSGAINGDGDYTFMLWATDADPDTFHIKIWEEDDGGNVTDSTQAIGGGSIVIHAKK